MPAAPAIQALSSFILCRYRYAFIKRVYYYSWFATLLHKYFETVLQHFLSCFCLFVVIIHRHAS